MVPLLLNGIGWLIVRSMFVRTQQLVAWDQTPVGKMLSPKMMVVELPSVMSAMLVVEFWYITPLSYIRQKTFVAAALTGVRLLQLELGAAMKPAAMLPR